MNFVTFLQNEGYQIFNHSLFDIDSYPTTIKHVDFWGIRELFDQYNLFFKLYYDVGYHLPSQINKIFNNKYFVNNPEVRKGFSDTVFDHLYAVNKNEERPTQVCLCSFSRCHIHLISLIQPENSLPNTPGTSEEAYIHQVAYSNRLIKQITDSIIAISKQTNCYYSTGRSWYHV